VQHGGAQARMNLRRLLPCLFVLLFIPGCKKTVGTSDTIKADLKNYLQIELPKAGSLFPLMALLSEKFKEKEGGDQPSKEKIPEFDEGNESKKLAQAVEALAKMQASTADVRRLHTDLQSGVAEIQASIQKIAGLEKETSSFSAVTGMIKAMKGLVDGIENLQDWRKHLEAGCKANGLEAEFGEFEKKYGWGG